MRFTLTLAWLCLCLAIYCGGRGNVALSLPPSLIAATEAVALRQLQQQQQQQLQQQQQQQEKRHEQPRWKKDARVLFDSGNDAVRDIEHSKESTKYNLPYNSNMDNQQLQLPLQSPNPLMDFNRKVSDEAYDLEARQQSTPQEIAQRHGQVQPRAEAEQGAQSPTLRHVGVGVAGGKYATPTPTQHNWNSLCQASNGNCRREYNRAMLAVRNRAAIARLQQQLHDIREDHSDSTGDYDEDDNEDYYTDAAAAATAAAEVANADAGKQVNNEVFMLLTGEQDLVKFLHWAMQRLYPHQHPGKLDANGADFQHPGMYIWKKLNFSGHLEPPLIVDEPRYVLVRRENQNSQDGGYKLGDDPKDDPFIPPRGRKHNAPDLDALLNRYETFVPNRGKRDKVKDLFKYDDLFYPNRGKKHRDIFKLNDNDPFFAHRGKKLQLRDLYNIDDPFFPNRGKRQQLTAKQRKLDSNFNSNYNFKWKSNWPLGMSTHEINSNDQSVKPSMSAGEDANRLHYYSASSSSSSSPSSSSASSLLPTRSMSANLQQLRLMMRPEQQVKTSWQRSLPNPRETQLTRGLLDSDSDIDIDYGQLDM